ARCSTRASSSSGRSTSPRNLRPTPQCPRSPDDSQSTGFDYYSDEMASVLSVPLLDIRETAAAAVQAAGNKRVGIIGTSQTILAGLYDETFSRHALDVLAPTAHTMEAVDRVIFDELVHGVTDGEAAGVVGCAVDELCDRGAEVVLLACTDLTHIAQTLLGQPVLDSTTIHARAAARMALREC
ncbi:aspartate/glutamate racemase family protein, partial [Nocardia farcinica]|nr:aspartate/glutamate racemase family protein [Nocardia farcinica]